MQDKFTNAATDSLAVWLMRHGSNVTDVAEGDDGSKLPLSDQGRREGQAMAAFIAEQKPQYPVLVLTSDFARNKETGGIVDGMLGQGGEVARVVVPAIRASETKDMATVYGLISNLDDPDVCKQVGLSVPPRTVIIIGNKRNLFLEYSRIVIDMKGEFIRMSQNPEAVAALDTDALKNMAESDNRQPFDDLIGSDGDMDMFEEGRLVGYDLGLTHWRGFPDADKVRLVVDQSFSETGKKWTLFMETQRQAARRQP